MLWDPAEQKAHRVTGYSFWLYIENYEYLENKAGVFIFANASQSVKYIGKAGAGKMSLEIARAIGEKKNFGATLVKALFTDSDKTAKSLGSDLIEKYEPANNARE
jgi:hypothetical protein